MQGDVRRRLVAHRDFVPATTVAETRRRSVRVTCSKSSPTSRLARRTGGRAAALRDTLTDDPVRETAKTTCVPRWQAMTRTEGVQHRAGRTHLGMTARTAAGPGFSADPVAVDVADGHDRSGTKHAVDQNVDQVPCERDELVDDHKSGCTDGADKQE